MAERRRSGERRHSGESRPRPDGERSADDPGEVAGTREDAPAIDCEDLTKSYGEVDALWEVDLEIPAGQAVVLVGHNGSGKSTLLNLAAGTLEVSGGMSFDMAPIPSYNLSPMLPDSNKLAFFLGASAMVMKGLRVSVAGLFAYYLPRDSKYYMVGEPGIEPGEYKSWAAIAQLSIRYKFDI